MSHQEEVHSCNECDFVAQAIGNLQHHKSKEHAKVQPVKCGKCTFTKDSATDLENYMKSTHAIDNKSITCRICMKKLDGNEDLDKHVFINHNNSLRTKREDSKEHLQHQIHHPTNLLMSNVKQLDTLQQTKEI